MLNSRAGTTAGVQPPPPFELRYFATVMCQYTGDTTQMFAHVRCLESKAHVYWLFDLREPYVPHEDLSAKQRKLYYFAHGSDTPGIEGMIHSRFSAPATLADGPDAVGHYSQATPWNDDASFIQTLDRMTNSAKWQCPVITQGYTSIPGTHFVSSPEAGTRPNSNVSFMTWFTSREITSMSCAEMHQDASFFRFL